MVFDATNGSLTRLRAAAPVLQRLRATIPPTVVTPPAEPLWYADLIYNLFASGSPKFPTTRENVTHGYASSVSAGSIVKDAATSPDGSVTSSNVVEDGTTAVREFSHSIRTEVGCYYAYSVYAKPVTRRYLRIFFGGTGFPANPFAMFDLQSRVVVTQGAGLVSATIGDALPNGYVRCEIVATCVTVPGQSCFMRPSPDGVNTSYAGSNGAVALSFWLPSLRLLSTGLPASQIHIASGSDLTTARTNLISDIFGVGGLPSEIGTLSSVASPVVPALTDLDTTQKITMVAYTARPRLWTPTSPNGKVVIQYEGHDNAAPGSTYNSYRSNEAIQQMLTAGFAVCGLVMPGGPDEVNSPDTHGSATLSDFVGPLVVAVNTLVDAGYTDIYMYGLSGGGWGSALAPAVDTRIKKSYGIAGSLPLYMEFAFGASARDAEQILPGIRTSLTYLDLYILCACGSGRRHRQILNITDPVIASQSDYNTGPAYADTLAALATTLSGDYDLTFYQSPNHEFDPAVLAALVLPEIT